jgi:class 3 adenylate cyclase
MWEERPDIAGAVMERHESLIRGRVHDEGGVLIRSKGEGDSTFSVFADACGAARAGIEIQRALDAEPWPDGGGIRVRAAIYAGDVELRDGDYYGAAPNRCARLRAAAHPGQTVCSHRGPRAAARPRGRRRRRRGRRRVPSHVVGHGVRPAGEVS